MVRDLSQTAFVSTDTEAFPGMELIAANAQPQKSKASLVLKTETTPPEHGNIKKCNAPPYW